RYVGQTERQAYDAAAGWIYLNALTAAQHLRDIWRKKLSEHRRPGRVHLHPLYHVDPLYVNDPLGNALHALQDSFSEAHVTRKNDNDTWVIVHIAIYDDANKNTRGTRPGHEALDKRWKQTPLGNEAIIAS